MTDEQVTDPADVLAGILAPDGAVGETLPDFTLHAYGVRIRVPVDLWRRLCETAAATGRTTDQEMLFALERHCGLAHG